MGGAVKQPHVHESHPAIAKRLRRAAGHLAMQIQDAAQALRRRA
jgi:hypothetical protein